MAAGGISPYECPDPPPSLWWRQLTRAECPGMGILFGKVNVLASGAVPNRKLPKTDFICERSDAQIVTVLNAG